MSNFAQNQIPAAVMSPAPASRLASDWSVHLRTAQRWVARFGPAVCADEAALADRLLRAGRCLDHVRERANKILAAQTPPSVLPASADDAEPGDRSLREFVGQQEDLLRGCIRRIAQANGPTPDNLTLTRESALAAKFSTNNGAARKQMAQLGIESGDLIARAAVARLVRAWFARACVALSRLRDTLAPELLELTTEAQAAAVLEPALIIAGLLDPFARVENLAAGCGLPDWFLAELRAAAADHVNPGDYSPLTVSEKN